MKEVIYWVVNVFEIDYSKVLISKGELLTLQNPVITAQANAQIQITWDDNTGQGLALAQDAFILVVYSEDLNMFQIFENTAVRADQQVNLQLPTFFTNQTLQCWASFVNDDRKLAATSLYLGTVNVL